MRKCSSAEHPPPFPRPHPRSPTPGGDDLGHPGRSRRWEEGLPSGISRGLQEAPRGCGDLSLRRQPPGQAHPPHPPRPRRSRPGSPAPPAPQPRLPPRAPLRLSAPRPARPPHLPRRAAARARAGWVTSGWDASLRPAGPSLSGDFFISLPNSRCLSLLSLFSPSPPPLLLSCLSALFSGLITFRIKAKPSPGCEYNAPPSPPGEERGAGAPRGGRGRGRAPRAARRRRGRGAREAALVAAGQPRAGTTSSASAAAQVGRGPPRQPRRGGLPPTPSRGSRCPQPERGPGLRASWNEGGEPERGLPLEPHFCFPEPHPATSAGPPSDREPLAFLGPQGESLGLGSEEGTIFRGCRECARRAHWRRTF